VSLVAGLAVWPNDADDRSASHFSNLSGLRAGFVINWNNKKGLEVKSREGNILQWETWEQESNTEECRLR
jgi:hypothetical protein